MSQQFKPIKVGDPITAAWANKIQDRVKCLPIPGKGSSGLESQAACGSVPLNPATRLQGKLDGALAVATAIDNPSTATMSVWGWKGGSFVDLGYNITVTNRATGISATSGTYVKAEKVQHAFNEWSIYAVDCP